MAGDRLDLSFAALAFGPDPIILLLLVLLVDVVLGAVRRRNGPPAGLAPQVLAPLIDALDRRLNREQRGAATRLIRGLLLVVFVAALGYLAGQVGAALWAQVPLGWIAGFLLVLGLIDQRRPFALAWDVSRALDGGDIGAARRAAAGLLGDAAPPDRHALGGRVAAALVVRFNEGLIAGVFWFVFLGLPGLAAYRAVNILAHRLSDDQARFVNFGFAASRLNEVACAVPALLAGLALTIAAIVVPGANPTRALTALARAAPRPLSRGWPVAAAFGAFGLAVDNWRTTPALLGGGLARALYLCAVAGLVNLGALALFAMLRLGL